MRSPHRYFISAGVLITAGWLLFLTLGQTLAQRIANAAGETLLRISNGKFNDPRMFVAGRVRDVLWIATVLLLAALAVWAIDAGARRFALYKKARGVWLGIILFVSLNAWWAISEHTVAFWCVFCVQPDLVDNNAQFHIKKYLNAELKASQRILLIGNSQLNTNVDEKVLNRLLGPEIWTTELTQSGAYGFETMLLLRDLREAEAALIIDYVSPVKFYTPTGGKVISHFLRWRDLPDVIKWGGIDKLPPKAIKVGLVGRLIPLLRDQVSISQRVLGGLMIFLPPKLSDMSPNDDLEGVALQYRNHLKMGPLAEFEKRAFANGIAEAVAHGRRILLIRGSHYPTAERLMDPRIRPDFEAFMDSLQQKYSGSVFFLPESELIQLDVSDFTDINHWKKETQEKFSERLAAKIPGYLKSSTASSSGLNLQNH